MSREFRGQEKVEAGCSETGASHDIDEVMMCEIHGGPIKYTGIRPGVRCKSREEVGDYECLEGAAAGMERREGPEHHGRVGKRGSVAV